MSPPSENSTEIFSFHLLKVPFLNLPGFLFRRLYKRGIKDLKHSESFLAMNLGEPVMSFRRFDFRSVAMFAWWTHDSHLEDFLKQPEHQCFDEGWHVRLKLYRRWGHISELENALANPELAPHNEPVVAVTLARLNLFQTLRFIKWGKPVESQVRDHKGKTLALAATRPFNTFSTFSIWKNEVEMLNMVAGRTPSPDGGNHKNAMTERVRKDFHFEFMTMRFAPYKESGTYRETFGAKSFRFYFNFEAHCEKRRCRPN